MKSESKTIADWLPILEVNRRMRRTWTWLAGLFFLFFLVQNILGQYAGMNALAWTWFLLSILPIGALLFWGEWGKPQADKWVDLAAAKGLRWALVIYLLVVMGTILLSQAAIQQGDLSLSAYLQQSLFWIIPFNGLVTVGLVFLLFTKRGLRRPKTKEVLRIAEEKGSQAANLGYKIAETALQLISESETEKAIALLKNYFHEHGPKKDHQKIILLNGQYNRVTEERNLGLLTMDDAQTHLNRITLSLIYYANSIQR